jgi:transposase-like protein
VKGRWCYLYRAIDSTGATIEVINTDQARLYGAAIPAVKEAGILPRRCRHRPVQYLNNILEQDHRAIKRRVKAKQNFREF